jgi:hypothetical protein
MAFAMGMDVLLLRNIGGDVHIAWSLFTQHLRMCIDVGGRLFPALSLIGNMFNRGLMTMFLIQYREARPLVCAEFLTQQVFLPLKYRDITF